MADRFTQDSCPCGQLPLSPMKTNHEDEAIVFDTVTMLKHRCRLCGRKFDVQMVPGDAMLGEHAASEGYDGQPALSITAAERGDYDRVLTAGEWKPRDDEG